MTPEKRELILSLVVSPRDRSGGDPEAVLRHFGTDDGAALGRTLLADALKREDGTDVELALIVCARFGYDATLMPLLLELEPADWHHKHEDVVSMLGKLKSPETIDTLFHATQWIPEYLDYDDSRALARKAIWALGGVSGAEATRALTLLLEDKDEELREAAAEQLRRRGELTG